MLNNNRIEFDYGFESVLDNLSDVFFLLNKEFRFLYLNPRARFFFSLEEFSEVSFWDVFPFESGSRLSETLTYSLLEQKKMSAEFYSTVHSRWFKITVSPFNNGFSILIADIHQQKLIQEKLKRNEKTFRMILNFLPHIAFIVNNKVEASYLNDRWAEYTGKSLEEGLGSNWKNSFHPEDYQKKLQYFNANKANGPFEFESRIKNSEGEYRWHLERIVPLPAKTGITTTWIGTATDIHEQKTTTKKLEEAEIMAQLGSFEASLDYLTVIDSPGTRRILGIPPDIKLSLKYMESISHPDDIKPIRKLLKKAIKQKAPYEYVRRIFLPSAEMRYLHIKGWVICDENDNPIKIFGILQDITERVAAEEAFKEQYHFAKKIAEASPDIITVTELGTFRITYTNITATGGGYLDSQLLEFNDETVKDLIHPEDFERFQNHKAAFKEAEDDYINEIEYRAKNASGDWRWLKTRGKVFQRNKKGEVTHLISLTHDVTDKKLTEKELQENDRFIKAIADASPDLILVYDLPSERISYINQEKYSDLGYNEIAQNTFTKHDMKDRIHPEDWEAFRNYHDKLSSSADDNVSEIEYQFKDKSGQWKWLRERGKVFQRNQEAEATQFLVIIQDITEQKEAQERLIQNELLNKLVEKKEEFMSVASHELKTPITTIKASIQVMKRLIEKRTDEKTLLVFITKALLQINKLTSMIGNLLDNAKIQAGKITLSNAPFFMQELIDEAVTHNLNHHKIVVKNRVKEPVYGDKVRLEQVLTNFLTNAIKYSPEGKEILIEADREDEFLKVSVTDYGIGIPQEKLPHVFDRFYRVEEKSQEFSGLGLGLYISAEIIKQHHGEYGVSSELEKGSTFWFKIPIRHF